MNILHQKLNDFKYNLVLIIERGYTCLNVLNVNNSIVALLRIFTWEMSGKDILHGLASIMDNFFGKYMWVR